MKKDSKPDYIGADYNFDTPLSSSVIDELPLWSAPFGLKLLDTVIYRKGITALDIGFGTGFPLIELAQRLGKTSVVYGIDPWRPSHIRTKFKINYHGINNASLIQCGAEKIPLKDKSVDLIVSNNGTNNVQDVEKVFGECSRVAKKGAQFVAAVNLEGTMNEFYKSFLKVLKNRGMKKEITALKKHIHEKRKPLEELESYFTKSGFRLRSVIVYEFVMKFTDTETFINHSLIKIGFLPAWNKLLDRKNKKMILKEILSGIKPDKDCSIRMTIPFAVIDAVRD